MNGYLRQSTASQSRLIGPFVDDGDFKTAETALTIANTDIKLRANGTTLANKASGGGTHQVNGLYSVTWDATDTANVGELSGSVVVAGALPVFFTYVVLEEAVYDALFASSAAGFGVAQTGDSFARIGATGSGLTSLATQASVNTIDDFLDTELAAVLAAVDTEIAAIFNRIGAPVAASISEDIANVSSGAVGVEVVCLGQVGDCKPGGALTVWYFTKKDGVPTALAGSPALSVYKDGSATPITAGITHAESVNAVVGLNRGTFNFAADGEAYSGNSDYVAVISTGTVGGLTAVGHPVAGFSLFARSPLRATDPDATAEISGDGFVTTTTSPPTVGDIWDEGALRTIAGVAEVGIVNDVAALVVTKHWAAAARTLSASGNTDAADAVWAAVNRALTDKSDFALTAEDKAALVDLVWDELMAGHVTAETTGEKLNASGAAGDPLTSAVPGAYGAGSAGKALGDIVSAIDPTGAADLDAALAAALAVQAKTDALPPDPADQSLLMAAIGGVAAPSAADNATAVWAKVIEAQGSITAQQALDYILAVAAGATGNTGLIFKTPNGSAVRVVATVNALNERTTITLTPSAP